MDKLEFLQSQKLILQAQITALDRMNDAHYWGLIITLKAGLAEIDRQIDEIIRADIL